MTRAIPDGVAHNIASTAASLLDDAMAWANNPTPQNAADLRASMRIMRNRIDKALQDVESPVFYEPSTDMMAIDLRPWPGGPDGDKEVEGYGAEDAGPDLVIHYAPDGPWLWEIENASTHPEHIVAALIKLRRLSK